MRARVIRPAFAYRGRGPGAVDKAEVALLAARMLVFSRAGGSLLVDVASVIAIGRHRPAFASGKTEKRLGALLKNAVPVVSVDDINVEPGGKIVLTRPVRLTSTRSSGRGCVTENDLPA